MGFLIWSMGSFFFIVLGVVCLFSKKEKPFGFWANVEMFQVNDVRAYNRALGKLWIVFSILLELIGIPILYGDDSPLILLTLIGTMLLSIATMIIYVIVIEPKYRVK